MYLIGVGFYSETSVITIVYHNDLQVGIEGALSEFVLLQL